MTGSWGLCCEWLFLLCGCVGVFLFFLLALTFREEVGWEGGAYACHC